MIQNLSQKLLRKLFMLALLFAVFGFFYIPYYFATSLVISNYNEKRVFGKRIEIIQIFNSIKRVNCSLIPSSFTDEFAMYRDGHYAGPYKGISSAVYDNLLSRFRKAELDEFWPGFIDHLNINSSGLLKPVKHKFFSNILFPMFKYPINWGFNNSFNDFYIQVAASWVSFDLENGIYNGQKIKTRLAKAKMRKLCDQKEKSLGVDTQYKAAIDAIENGKRDIYLSDKEADYILKAFRVFSMNLKKNTDGMERAYLKAKADRIYFHLIMVVIFVMLGIGGLCLKELLRRKVKDS